MPYVEDDESSPKKRLALPIKIAFGLITVLFFAILLGYSLIYENAQGDRHRDRVLLELNAQRLTDQAISIKENADRIADIQASRLASCQRTYSGIREVFGPFIPKNPTTPRQAEIIEQFNTNIIRLKRNCIHQVQPKSKPKPKKERDPKND